MKQKFGFRQASVFVWQYWKQVPWLLSGAFVTMALATLCDVFLPVFAGRLIDSLADAAFAERAVRIDDAYWALAAFVGISAAFHVFREASYRFWIPLATVTMRRIVCDAFYRVQRFSADWQANAFAGATVRKVSRGMWAYDEFADTIYIGFLPAGIVLVGITANLMVHWLLMGVFVLVAVVIYLLVSVLLVALYVAPSNAIMNKSDSAVGAAMADAVSCNATVKSFGAELREDRRFFDVSDLWQRRARKAWSREINSGTVLSVMTLLLQGGLLSLALWYWSRGQATAGDVTFVMTSYFVIHGYLREIGQHVRNMQKAINEIEDLVGFEKQVIEVADRESAQPLAARGGAIDFDGVTFRYGNQEAPIYADFNLRVGAGERVALVGPSGSGKSTFVKLVQRLYDVDEGRIMIDGQNIAEATQESLRRAIALVPQDPALFHRSLSENIAYGRPDARQEEIEVAARRAHAHDFISRLPQGYETLVGERGVKLSGGERQRVALARAFLADAPILILDEATSSLDSITEAQIQEAIEELMEGRTTIVIAHRLSTVRSVDRILVFREGAIVEQGTQKELAALRDGHFKELLEMQVQGLVLDDG
ncbi:ABC transporter ATP-binding protein [Pelagibius litoralis]|uniref:ABC transporter ATP-binding protein n=1 Tax=Pelagibius litoralis TaxID=374515 RepID=A0A967K6Y5_9PROT|nr:ABC transporter ATP-binding protein [Pelagibius litoralis]NIA69523.1 ABC transporter ATP-binding protein [Pelagibius litoralis]